MVFVSPHQECFPSERAEVTSTELPERLGVQQSFRLPEYDSTGRVGYSTATWSSRKRRRGARRPRSGLVFASSRHQSVCLSFAALAKHSQGRAKRANPFGERSQIQPTNKSAPTRSESRDARPAHDQPYVLICTVGMAPTCYGAGSASVQQVWTGDRTPRLHIFINEPLHCRYEYLGKSEPGVSPILSGTILLLPTSKLNTGDHCANGTLRTHKRSCPAKGGGRIAAVCRHEA
jgi:hypothetical protein